MRMRDVLKSRIAVLACTGLLVTWLTSTAGAFGEEGHRIVGLVAELHLKADSPGEKASALAVLMLAILLVPIILFNRNQTKELEGKL